MPKPKWNLNTIYISERLQESLRPISRCAMTTVVAPMGYGKTTAVDWYLEERAKAETLKMIRISVYSDNLAIFWKSVQEAFFRAGFDILRDYPCPTDAAGGGLLVDDLCHALADETPCYLFIDDFHLLTDKRASLFLCMLANRLPSNVHLIVASRDRFLPAAEAVRLGAKVYQIGTEQLRLNHTELAVYAHRCGTELSDAQVESLLYSSEGWFSAVYLNLRTLSERGVLPSRHSDIYATFTAAMIDPLPEPQREFLAVMGLADEFTVEMAQYITGDGDAGQILSALTEQNAFVTRLQDGATYRFHHMMKECAERSFQAMPVETQQRYWERFGLWYEQHRQYLHALAAYRKSGNYDALLRVIRSDAGILLASLKPEDVLTALDNCPAETLKALPLCHSGADAPDVHLAADPEDAGAESPAADGHRRTSGAVRRRARQPAGGMRPHSELSLLQRHQRHEPPAPQRQRADVPPRHQHPVERRLDLWLTVRSDDVPPCTGSDGKRACGDGRVHAPLLQGHESPRAGRGDHHARRGAVLSGALHGCPH